MKNTDLRIGNKLQKENGEIFTVLRVDGTNDVLVEEQRGLLTLDYNLFGLPLTEEWLIKYGFEKTHPDGWVWSLKMPKDDATLQIWSGNDYMSICRSGIAAYHFECKYVHQLQNLYFSLTNEELTIKS